MNFILSEMTFLRYYAPLVAEGNSRGIKSKFFILGNHKYNNPLAFQDQLKEFCKENQVEMYELEDIKDHFGVTFTIEGMWAGMTKLEDPRNTMVSLTYMTDFYPLYDNYIDVVDHVIMPSRYFADYLGYHGPKNLYLGSPKYDVTLDKNEIISKYGLSNNKKALFIAPRLRDTDRVDILRLYEILREQGFDVVVKTRGKDPIRREPYRGDYYFADDCWFPHTSMELLAVSDLVINFSSSAIKEAVLLKKPVINFHIKPFKMPLEYLYDYEYCEVFGNEINEKDIKNAINRLTTSDFNDIFDKVIKDFLFTGNSSKRILDHLGLK